VKKNNLTNSLFAVVLLSSPIVGAETKYPAADFQPEIVYQDKEYIEKNSSSAKPAAAPKASAKVEADSKYPAANFEPQVVFSDPNYKSTPSAAKKEVVSTSSAEVSESVAETVSEAPAVQEKAESSPNYFIILLGLGLAGAYLLKDQFGSSNKSAESPAPAQTKYASGLTGVGRYLNKVSGTGVSRYLDNQIKSATAATGVAKYMAKQTLAAKSGTETGVEKYMRDRG